MNTTYGAAPQLLKCRLFDALVVPVLSYGCEIWGTYPEKRLSAEVGGGPHSVPERYARAAHQHPFSYSVSREFGRTPLRLHWGQQVVRKMEQAHVSP